jgi:hypothetical protein
MRAVDPRKICVLITVYHPYRWVAAHTWSFIERFWPGHPPVFFCGLTSDEAGGLPHLPVGKPEQPRVWSVFAHEAACELRRREFELCYFVLEDHPPLAECHAQHLGETLPGWMASLPASYLGLMGWDNRRFATRGGPVLEKSRGRVMHLSNPDAPRFHLHPSLFRMDALISCLALLSLTERPNPWGFEKLCDKVSVPLHEPDKEACYQVCGEELCGASAAGRAMSGVERFVFHKAMNVFPVLNKVGLGMVFWDMLGFDDFFYRGPYPMFYSGVMSRGRVNPFFLRYVKKHRDPMFDDLMAAARREGAT